MKKTNTIYWTITGLVSAFMLMAAITDILVIPDAKAQFNHLGYPEYLIPFIGVAKLLGVIAILIPGFARIKEWAYAGLLFDLAGAAYSMIATDGIQPDVFIMILPVTFLIISYRYHHKRLVRSEKVSIEEHSDVTSIA